MTFCDWKNGRPCSAKTRYNLSSMSGQLQVADVLFPRLGDISADPADVATFLAETFISQLFTPSIRKEKGAVKIVGQILAAFEEAFVANSIAKAPKKIKESVELIQVVLWTLRILHDQSLMVLVKCDSLAKVKLCLEGKLSDSRFNTIADELAESKFHVQRKRDYLRVRIDAATISADDAHSLYRRLHRPTIEIIREALECVPKCVEQLGMARCCLGVRGTG